MTRTILLLVVGIVGLHAVAYAQGERLPWQVLGSGGAIASVSGQVLLSGTIGQPIIGIGVEGQTRISQGFWLPIVTPTSIDEDRANERSLGVSNFPNPFTYGTTIRVTAPIEGALSIRIFDLVGNLVRTIDAVVSMTGGQDIYFDGLDNAGQPLGSGAYMYEVSGRTVLDGQPIYRVQRMQIIR